MNSSHSFELQVCEDCSSFQLIAFQGLQFWIDRMIPYLYVFKVQPMIWFESKSDYLRVLLKMTFILFWLIIYIYDNSNLSILIKFNYNMSVFIYEF